jgi:hypothetical protein
VAACPDRRTLEDLPRRHRKDGRRRKADVYEIEWRGRVLVVKDFRRVRARLRWFGRWQIARECAAYRVLAGEPGVPGFVGRIDPWALAVERIEAVPLVFAANRFVDGLRHVHRLRAVVDRIHARGVAHLDLRGRENILLDAAGEVRIVDFAGSVVLRPGGLANRLLFRRLAALDDSAVLKWKRLLAPHRMTPEEAGRVRRFRRFVRPLWPVNRKAAGREGPDR